MDTREGVESHRRRKIGFRKSFGELASSDSRRSERALCNFVELCGDFVRCFVVLCGDFLELRERKRKSYSKRISQQTLTNKFRKVIQLFLF